MEEAMRASSKRFAAGEIVKGIILEVRNKEVLVDIGYKSEGVIPSRELSIRNDVNPSEVVKPGEQIEALVPGQRGDLGVEQDVALHIEAVSQPAAVQAA